MSHAARDAQPPLGIWSESTADPNGAAVVTEHTFLLINNTGATIDRVGYRTAGSERA